MLACSSIASFLFCLCDSLPLKSALTIPFPHDCGYPKHNLLLLRRRRRPLALAPDPDPAPLVLSFHHKPILQFGSPDSEELYIHRLGRTARAGKEGHGIQVLLPFEDAVTSTLHRNKVESDTELLKLVRSAPADVLQCVENVRKRTGNEDMSIVGLAEGASRSFLAYYLNRCKGLKITDETVVAAATEFALSTGLPSLPSFDEKTAKKIGIMNLRGVEVV